MQNTVIHSAKKLGKKTWSIVVAVILSRVFVVLTITIFTALFLLFYYPPHTPNLEMAAAQSKPAQNYNAGVDIFKTYQELDTQETINPVCKSASLLHGEQKPISIILFHGFTNCPAQYSELGQQLYNQGYNVLIPRIPSHGFQDKLSEKTGILSDTQLVNMVHTVVDSATGLGKQVYVFGLSGGGVMAATAAYYRAEVIKTIIAAPLFLPAGQDSQFVPVYLNTMTLLPNYFTWWDSKNKENAGGPAYGYARYSSKAALAFMQVTHQLIKDIGTNPAKNTNKEKSIISLLVENDGSVDNPYIKKQMEIWSRRHNVTHSSYTFPATTNLTHDFIDPSQGQEKMNIAYGKILELLK
jgi:esterase/lipase